MKINLEYPFSNDWRLGYIVTNPENRKVVILYNNKIQRSSISYARYLMSISLKRYLNDDEHADHIDNNKTNDIIENLQILTQKENNKKSGKGRTYLSFTCPICNIKFKIEKRQSKNKKNKVLF
ncbi:MAG: hypothetical protein EKK61_05670 [Rickettsiales bacterium]|nr:MAG: hypothetical protein EKK61_05670 [Rickettsiales bacterium]